MLDTRLATPACSLGPFDWKSFPILYSEVVSSLRLGVFLVCNRVMDPVFVSILSACVFIGELSPLILRDINNQ